MKYRPTEQQLRDLDNRFTHHAPKDGQPLRYAGLRQQANDLAVAILEDTPPGREQSLALTNLEQAVMWANAAIARHE